MKFEINVKDLTECISYIKKNEESLLKNGINNKELVAYILVLMVAVRDLMIVNNRQ